MPSLDGLLIVVAVGFAAPFLLGLAPGLRIPAVVLEIVAGIVVGPSVLGLGRDRRHDRGAGDARPRVPALPRRPRGRLPAPARTSAAASRCAATRCRSRSRVAVSFAARRPVETPLLVAIALELDVARRAHPGAQGHWPDRVAARAARDRRRLDRRLRRDHPALAVLRRRGRPGRHARAARRPARAGADRLRRRARRPTLDAHPRRPAPPAGHDRPDPRARRDRPARGVRRGSRGARPRGHPRHVRRRRDPLARRSRPRDDAPRLPAQARGDRLRRLHPRLLRGQRGPVRPRGTRQEACRWCRCSCSPCSSCAACRR